MEEQQLRERIDLYIKMRQSVASSEMDSVQDESAY